MTVDNADGLVRAVDYLAAHGHRSIGHLRGPESTHSGEHRYRGFIAGLDMNGLAVRDEWIWQGHFAARDGWRCGTELIEMEERPTAVVCGNDLMALGLLQALQQEGWGLPHHISIVGFDDIEASQWSVPALTTVSQRSDRLVDLATELLTDRLNTTQATSPPRDLRLSPRLMPRASVATVADPASY